MAKLNVEDERAKQKCRRSSVRRKNRVKRPNNGIPRLIFARKQSDQSKGSSLDAKYNLDLLIKSKSTGNVRHDLGSAVA